MQTSVKQQCVTPSPTPIQAYSQARTRIRDLLQITDENSKDLTLPEQERSQWLFQHVSKQVKTEEEEEVVENGIQPRKLRKINEHNEHFAISIEEALPKQEEEEQPPVELSEKEPQEEETHPQMDTSIIDDLASSQGQVSEWSPTSTNLEVSQVSHYNCHFTPALARSCNRAQEDEEWPDWLDEEMITTYAPRQSEPLSEKPQETTEESIRNVKRESANRTAKVESKSNETINKVTLASDVRRELTPDGKAGTTSDGKAIVIQSGKPVLGPDDKTLPVPGEKRRMKVQKKQIIELIDENDSESCKKQLSSTQRPFSRHITEAFTFVNQAGNNQALNHQNQVCGLFMIQEQQRIWLGRQKRLRNKVMHTKKEFERTLEIMGRRLLFEKQESNGTAIYEYMWTFGEVSCWKPLTEYESLLKLYLCQAKAQNAPILKLLPDVLESDISSLISKIELCPNSHLDDDREFEIERTLFSHFLFVEVSKFFQQTMLLKAFVFNRKANRLPQQHVSPQVEHRKRRTLFIDLEGEQMSQNSRINSHQSHSLPSRNPS